MGFTEAHPLKVHYIMWILQIHKSLCTKIYGLGTGNKIAIFLLSLNHYILCYKWRYINRLAII